MSAIEDGCAKTIDSMRSLFDFLLRRNRELEDEVSRLKVLVGSPEDRVFELEQSRAA